MCDSGGGDTKAPKWQIGTNSKPGKVGSGADIMAHKGFTTWYWQSENGSKVPLETFSLNSQLQITLTLPAFFIVFCDVSTFVIDWYLEFADTF